MTAASYTVLDSPIGPLTLVAGEAGLKAIYFPREGKAPPEGAARVDDMPAATQLREYFAGERTRFDLALDPDGTDFQRAVWRALCDIPFGETVSYSAIAEAVGRPSAVRAVGAANGRNPIPIIVPCHRVIGKSGALTGYAGGLDVKRILLDLEAGQGRML